MCDAAVDEEKSCEEEREEEAAAAADSKMIRIHEMPGSARML